jgi:hypothetical protein
MLTTYVRNDTFTGTSTPTCGGSREHYFHFLIGYLLPLVHAQTTLRRDRFLVLDCGPLMTPILAETLKRLDFHFEVVAPREITNPFYVEAWDHGWDRTADVRKAAELMLSAWKNSPCPQSDCARSENLLIQRCASHDYYTQGAAEISGYGTGRRGITNWPEVSAHLTRLGIPHLVYEAGRHSLGCQMATYSQARRIVAMRGAEWANTVWTQPGVRVRVIDPTPPAELLTGFLDRLGVRHEFAMVNELHAPENPLEVARFLTEE